MPVPVAGDHATIATMPRLRAADVRAYLARDWARARDLKRAYWRDRLDRGGLGEAIRVTELMRGSSTDARRDDDLETHRRVAQALARTTPRPPGATRGAARARRVR